MRGWPGTVSRAKDDVIVSLKNTDPNPVAFGAPVFLRAAGTGVMNFSSGVTTPEQFAGFAVRVPDKAPGTYPVRQEEDAAEGVYPPGDTADILVRGSVTVRMLTPGAKAGDKVYIRVSDGMLVTAAGESGSTAELPNVTVRGPRDSSGCCEVTVTKRNLI